MRTLIAFIQMTLDGYFAGENGDISWAKKDRNDPEWDTFVAGNANSGGMLLFGRVTYQLMASYWPTPHASENDPVVAERMNNLPKVVFSNTLDEASWSNTELMKGDMVAHVRRMKSEPGADMAILGSGSIIAQLAREGLIDEFQFVVNPVILGRGKMIFNGIEKMLNLTLTTTRAFGNGNVLLCYEPTR